jgi:ectoine hydroxylase-related dioxygenase (phytanoyl-CoA dioxygenase family)
MSASEAGDLLAALEAAERAAPQSLQASNRNNAHLEFPFLAEITTDRRIVDVVEALIGSDISLWSTVLFAKEPDSSAYVSWHQDATYMGVAGDNHVTAWLALTPSTTGNGCVSVIPGTHRNGMLPHRDTFADDNILTRGQNVDSIDESAAVPLELAPGQMSLHHPWLVHGSLPNGSNSRRVGFALQSYLGAGMEPTRGTHYVTHVRGRGADRAFLQLPLPSRDAEQDSTNRSLANAAFADVLYDGAEKRRDL